MRVCGHVAGLLTVAVAVLLACTLGGCADARRGQASATSFAVLRGHTDFVSSVAFSPDGHTVASASFDKTIRLWDVRTHKQQGRPLIDRTDRVFGVAFSPRWLIPFVG
jgi:WD40 repeat protein